MPLSVFKVPYLARGPKQLPPLLTTVLEQHTPLWETTLSTVTWLFVGGGVDFLWFVEGNNGGK